MQTRKARAYVAAAQNEAGHAAGVFLAQDADDDAIAAKASTMVIFAIIGIPNRSCALGANRFLDGAPVCPIRPLLRNRTMPKCAKLRGHGGAHDGCGCARRWRATRRAASCARGIDRNRDTRGSRPCGHGRRSRRQLRRYVRWRCSRVLLPKLGPRKRATCATFVRCAVGVHFVAHGFRLVAECV